MADLVEMQQFSKWNKGYRYLPVVLDMFSKYGCIEPPRDKKGKTVTKAFEKLFKEADNHNICGSISAKNSITRI